MILQAIKHLINNSPFAIKQNLEDRYSFTLNPFSKLLFYLIVFGLSIFSYLFYVLNIFVGSFLILPLLGYYVFLQLLFGNAIIGVLLLFIIFFTVGILGFLSKNSDKFLKILVVVLFFGMVLSAIFSFLYLAGTATGVDFTIYSNPDTTMTNNGEVEIQELYGFGNILRAIASQLELAGLIFFAVFVSLIFLIAPDVLLRRQTIYLRAILSICFCFVAFFLITNIMGNSSFIYFINILIGASAVSIILEAWIPIIKKPTTIRSEEFKYIKKYLRMRNVAGRESGQKPQAGE